MNIKTIFKVFVNGVANGLMPKVQEKARKLGLPQWAVVLDKKREETKVSCTVDSGMIIPDVPGFVPQFINYGLPAKLGTAVVVAEIRNKQTNKMEIRVFKPFNGNKPTLYFQKGMVFNLWGRSLEVFYLGAEVQEEDGKKCWHPVFKPMFERSLPPFVVNDQQMREYLRGELKGKVLDSYLMAVNELTLNPVMEKAERLSGYRDKASNHGVDIGFKKGDGLPGTKVAESEPGDELSDEEKQAKAGAELSELSKGGKKDNATTDKKPSGKPQPKEKKKSNSQLLADAKAGVVDEAAE